MSYTARINNLINFSDRVTKIDIDFDEGQVQTFLKLDIPEYFDVTYKDTGTKTVRVSTYTSKTTTPVIQVFENLINVVNTYDTVDSTYYTTSSTEFNIPYSTSPTITPDEWITHSNFNKCIKKIYSNFEYLISKAKFYDSNSTEYQGWYGVAGLESMLDCGTGNWTWSYARQHTELTWNEMLSSNNTSVFKNCCSWYSASCGLPTRTTKDSLTWLWKFVKKQQVNEVTWGDIKTESTHKYNNLQWRQLSCNTYTEVTTAKSTESNTFITDMLADTQILATFDGCAVGSRWHLKIPKLDGYVDTVGNTQNSAISCIPFSEGCIYSDIFVEDDIMFTSTNTSVRACSTNIISTPIKPMLIGLDKNINFSNITAITKDKNDRIYVCDSDINGVACFKFNKSRYIKWSKVYSMYGLGSTYNQYKFNKPIDIVIDEFSNLYVLDSGNYCIKMYTSRGQWLRTFELPVSDAPISLTIDSDKRIHLLYKTYVNIYDIVANSMVKSYNISNNITPVKIRNNFSKEIIYIVYSNKIEKYFKNGNKFTDIDISYPKCLNNFTNIHQDENRNLYILTNDYIVKYTDLMFLDSKLHTDSYLNISNYMWSLSDILIDRNEFLQDVTYNKSFHRLWDNVEILRSAVKNKENIDLKPIHDKEKIFIGQNEIATTGVINRCMKYIWENLSTLNKYLSN